MIAIRAKGYGSRVAWVVAIVLGAGVALSVVISRSTPRADADVVTTTVTIGTIEQTVMAIGKVQPRELVHVGAQVTGRINRLHVASGDRVRAGQLIAEVDAQQQTSALQNAEAAVTSLQAQRDARRAVLSQARLVLERQRTLIGKGFTPRADYDNAEAAVKVIQAEIASLAAQIEQAKTQVDTARINLSYTRITAPIDGTVVAIVTKQGQTLNAFQSTPTIVVLADLDTMVVRAEISEADVSKLTKGQPVWFTTLGAPEQRHNAHIERIEPGPTTLASEATGTGGNTAIYYHAIFEVPNPQGVLRPSMTVQVSVLLAKAERVLTIPSAALGERVAPAIYLVQVIDAKGHLDSRRVAVGLNNNVHAEVRSGLRLGERVVLGDASKAPADAAPSLMDFGS